MHVASLVIKRRVSDPTNGATHYVAYGSLKRIPKWARLFDTVATIENHTFLRRLKHNY